MNRLLRFVGIVVLAALACGCAKDLGVERVSPTVGILTGGEPIDIIGSGFPRDTGITVYFGNAKADNVMVRSDEKITVSTPPTKVEQKVDVRIIMDDGRELLLKQAFEYVNKATGQVKEVGSIDQRKNVLE